MAVYQATLGSRAPQAMRGQLPLAGPAQDEALRQQAAAQLQHIYRWFEKSLPQVPQLAELLPPMIVAVQLYQARQFAPCLHQAATVAANVRQARWAFPMLPPL